MHAPLPEKPCATCGRRITWRKKWARDWENVRHCSDRCRSQKKGPAGDALEAAILAALERRARDASICPSEVARAEGGEAWRALMETEHGT